MSDTKYSEGRAASITVGTTTVELDGGLHDAKATVILNNSSNTIYLGFLSTVTTSDGFPLAASEKLTLGGHVRLYGIAAQAGNDVRVMELS
jgi:hypothetical protein